MAEPLVPHDIARRAFEIVRRGYDQQAVRAFLHEVSSLVERLQRSEREQRERAERAESRAAQVEHPDEADMLALLGEETTRVLTSAKDAAGEIRSKAETAAERVIADATAEAATTRSAAVNDAAIIRADAKEESEAILAQARSELARRSEEAEEAAARIRDEAATEAEDLREQGRADLAAAREEAEAVIEAAKAEGKSMVIEAQTVRERVLRDLQVRRKKARLQVEKLNAGRERLLQAYEVVRRTVGEATDELSVSLTDARVAADAAARRLENEPELTLEQLDAEVSAAGLADLPITDSDEEHHDDGSPGPFSGEVPIVDTEDAAPGAPTDEVPAEGATADAPAPVSEITQERRSRRSRRKKGFEGIPADALTRVEPGGEEEGVRIVADTAGDGDAGAATAGDGEAADAEAEREASGDVEAAHAEADGSASGTAQAGEDQGAGDESAGDEHAGTDAGGAKAHDVFARLRAEQTGTEKAEDGAAASDATPEETEAAEVADPGTDDSSDGEEAPDEEAVPFTARAEVLAPIEKELARRLKRALADEQNEVLDLLRRAKPKGVDDLLPSADDHAARWAEAATAPLGEAAEAGAAWAGGSSGSVLDLADELARSLVGPLRERVDRSFAASDGNLDDVADRVRALYREWKGKRLTETTQHFTVAAYGRGAFDAVDAGAEVRWLVDPSTPPCPDCDDNVLAGAISKGEEFPTGSPCAPAHTGCHCLVVVA